MASLVPGLCAGPAEGQGEMVSEGAPKLVKGSRQPVAWPALKRLSAILPKDTALLR